MAALREAVGPDIHLMVDLHWKFTAGEAVRVIRQLEQHDLYFAEAPCEPEDIDGQEIVARGIGCPLALGEEWRTAFEYRPRFEKRCMSIIQPEMGHTASRNSCRSAAWRTPSTSTPSRMPPSASASSWLASLQATASLKRVPYHEYQHSIFDKNLRYVTGDMGCEAGFYRIPTGPGLGVEPHPSVFDHVIG